MRGQIDFGYHHACAFRCPRQHAAPRIDDHRAAVTLFAVAVRADLHLLTQLFQNLFGNSIKYRQQGQPAVIRVTARTGQDSVTIAVEDNGIGVDPAHSERIFGVFQRLHMDEKLYSGTGIGLALCRRIAESHDGGIVLDTSYRDGARFIVTLPA